MALPPALQGRLRLPVVAAPMFLGSGPDLVVACCNAGILGSFPALNARSTAGFEAWLDEIDARLAPGAAPYGVNLIVHRSNPRLEADLEAVVRRKVPVVITSLGAVRDIVGAVQSYGGLALHDVISRRHAEKAAEAGVDGLIAVCAGAGDMRGRSAPSRSFRRFARSSTGWCCWPAPSRPAPMCWRPRRWGRISPIWAHASSPPARRWRARRRRR